MNLLSNFCDIDYIYKYIPKKLWWDNLNSTRKNYHVKYINIDKNKSQDMYYLKNIKVEAINR